MKDIELIDHTLQRIAQYGDCEIEISTKHLEKICKLALEHLIEQSHKHAVMPGLPTNEAIEDKPSSSPAVASGAVGKGVSDGNKLCECYDPFPDENNKCRNCNGSLVRA